VSPRSVAVNALTFSRVPLIFAWLGFALAFEFRRSVPLMVAACGMMFLSGITDLFDGLLARRWNVVTPLGKMADPLMDKVFYAVAFPALTWLVMHQNGGEAHSLLMLVFTILYILRDLWVTFLRSVGAAFGADVAAMWLGKVRTALSFPAAGWVYAYLAMRLYLPDASPAGVWWLWSCYAVEAAMIVLNLYSAYAYTMAYLPYLRLALERK
jgi:CDP-diacylglycerol--glycerol-3-phosphate 3-phosphatidyltransferase